MLACLNLVGKIDDKKIGEQMFQKRQEGKMGCSINFKKEKPFSESRTEKRRNSKNI